MKKALHILFFLLCATAVVVAQPIAAPRAANGVARDTGSANPLVAADSLAKDTILPFAIAKDGLTVAVDYEASDSIIVDNPNNLMFLYDKAKLNYEDLELKADSIVIDVKNSVAFAAGKRDTTGRIVGKPNFKQAEQEFKANAMRYNFKTKKGIIYEARSKQGDMYVLGEKSKFVGQGTDSTGATQNIIYSKNAFLTTCNAEQPHFGILSSRQKVIPNEVAIVGASSLVLGGVPIPIIPFGFFPLSKSKRAGLIIPRDYEFSQAWGFGIRNIGYYTPISDYQDLTITGDLFFNLTYGIHAVSNYKKRYRFNSRLGLDFASNRNEIPTTGVYARSNAFGIRLSLNQEAGAHPTETWGGSINITTNSYDRTNRNDARSVLNNSLNSNLSFSKRFAGKPYSLSVAMTHTQNVATREMSISLPNFNFNTETLFPFKNSSRGGAERWYDKITLRYSATAQNTFRTTDTTLFTKKTLDDARFGARQDVQTEANFTLFKYFQVTPSINYSEIWNFNTIKKQFDPTLKIKNDTIFNTDSTDFRVKRDTTFGKVDVLQKNGFRPQRQFRTGVSVQTKIYGMLWQSTKGWLRGIRHVMTPSVSMSYAPDYDSRPFRYFDTVSTNARAPRNNVSRYSYFEQGLYGSPPAGGRQMLLSYSINNNFEAKFRGKRDTADRKVKLLENVSVSGSYNMAADSFKWSDVSLSTNTNLFKGITNVTLMASLSPYAASYNGEKIVQRKELLWNTNKQLVRLKSAQVTFNTGFSVGRIRELFKKKETPKDSAQIAAEANKKPLRNNTQSKEKIDIWNIFDNFNVSHYLVFNANKTFLGKDTLLISTNSLSFSGSLKLSEKWMLTVGNIGYDFNSKSITYPDFTFYRDLHCWEMGANWQPERGTYSFFIRVKPSTLGFLDVPYNRLVPNDGFRGF